MDEVEVVVAHTERATLRVDDVFLTADADQARIGIEVEAMPFPPVPTPEIPWRKPPVLAIAVLPGVTLGRLGGLPTGSSAAWAAAGAAIRKLHDAPLPPRTGRTGRGTVELVAELDYECELLVTNGLLLTDLLAHNRHVAETALRPCGRDPAAGALRQFLLLPLPAAAETALSLRMSYIGATSWRRTWPTRPCVDSGS